MDNFLPHISTEEVCPQCGLYISECGHGISKLEDEEEVIVKPLNFEPDEEDIIDDLFDTPSERWGKIGPGRKGYR